MPTQVQFRRGTTAQNNNFTGAAGELSVNTSNSSIRVHDGSTQGGFELGSMNRSLRQFASTTSSELRSVLSDETGTGNAVFSLSPTILSPTIETSIVAGNTTFDLVNTTATTVNFAGAATTLEIGAATGLTNINNNLEVDGDIQIDGGDLTFNTSTANIVNATSTTVNFAGAATTLNIGAVSGTTTVNNNLTVASNSLASNGIVTNSFTAGTLQTSGNVNGNNGRFTTALTAATLQASGNLNAAASLISGNFNATGNVNAVDGRFSTALTAATLQASGNVNAAAGRIAGNFSTTGVLRVSDTTAATGENTGAAIISGGASIGGNLYVGGNLFIAGTTTTVNSNVTILDDPILYLADNSTSDVLDIGLVGTFNNGTQQHGGFIRDATDGVWKIFSNVVPEPNINGTVDFTSATYDAVRMGALTATSGTFSSTISATSSNVNASSALFTGSVTGGTLQTTGNLNAAAGLISGNFNATGAVNAASMRVGSSGLTLLGSTSGTIALQPTSTAGTTTITLPATTGTVVTTGDSGTVTSTMIADGTIVNADINASAAIAVSKLAASTISGVTLGNNLNTLTLATSGTGLSGSTTYNGSGAATFTVTSNATSANTGSAIVARDSSGNFSAGTITATLSGTATQVSNSLTAGTGLSGTAFNGSGAQTWTLATSGVTAGTYGGAGTVPVYTVDVYGRKTSASNVAIGGSLTGITGVGTISTGTWQGSSISTTYTDAKVTAVNAGTGISVNQTTGSLTVTNSGVTSLVAGTNISISGSTGAVTVNVSGTVAAATNATNSSNSAVTDDTTTNATHYPNFVAGTSGNQAEKVSSTKLTFNPSSGLLTSTDYNSSSDKRLKSNIKTVEGALDKVNSLRGVTFKWKEGGSDSIGLIAQEVQKVIPEVVTKDDNGYLGIRYTNIIGVLVEAIKEQQDQINTLKKQIEKLNG
jgi:hypothetical protein